MNRVKLIAGALGGFARWVLSKEAAQTIGGIASGISFVAGELLGEGIWVEGNLLQTALNAIPHLGYWAAGFAIRSQVFSKQTVEAIQEEAAITGTTPPLPTPP